MAKRDFLITRSYKTAFVFDFVFVLINLLAFYFISETIGEVDRNLGSAPNFFAYASVGMAITIVIQTASVGLAGRIREEQLTGGLELLAAQPITSAEIALGLAGFSFAFATIRAAIYIVLSLLLIEAPTPPDWVGFLAVLIAVGIAIGGFGVAIGGLILIFKRGEGPAALIPFALGMLGGALFPIAVLPALLQSVATVVPTRFAFDGVRDSLFLGRDWLDDFAWLLLTTAIILPLGLLLFDRALAHSKRRGSLSEY